MPHHLDPDTKKLVVQLTSATSLVLGSFMLAGQWFILPKLRRRETIQKKNKNLLIGCILTLIFMSIASTLLTLPVVYLFEDSGQDSAAPSLTSSINFCEEDFQHSRYIAEPANVASSLGSYVPLALLSLFGPPSKQWKSHEASQRFVAVWLTLLSIGLGSTALHALLTSYAQGGDELPMLWYTASTSYCLLDVIVRGWKYEPSSSSSKKQDGIGTTYSSSGWLQWAVVISAIAATATYIVNRSDFVIFYMLFMVYSEINLVGLLYVVFFFDWESRQPFGQQAGLYFRSRILIPLTLAVGTMTIVAICTWVSEMILCEAATRSEDPIYGEFGIFVWNRLIHPLWHCTSAMMAWILAWIVLAAHGMQREWGIPRIEWFGAPYIVFDPVDDKIGTNSVSETTMNQHEKRQ